MQRTAALDDEPIWQYLFLGIAKDNEPKRRELIISEMDEHQMKITRKILKFLLDQKMALPSNLENKLRRDFQFLADVADNDNIPLQTRKNSLARIKGGSMSEFFKIWMLREKSLKRLRSEKRKKNRKEKK